MFQDTAGEKLQKTWENVLSNPVRGNEKSVIFVLFLVLVLVLVLQYFFVLVLVLPFICLSVSLILRSRRISNLLTKTC